MADILTQRDDFERFYLKAPNTNSILVKGGPGGWNNDFLEMDRHEVYHGIFNIFTETLTFYNKDAEYIENAYKIGGINSKVYLIKRILKEHNNEIKWVDDYIGIADWSTKSIKINKLEIKFNSNDLAEILKTHENDEFEMERKDSIDDLLLDNAEINKVGIEGRVLTSFGSSVLVSNTEGGPGPYQNVIIGDRQKVSAITRIVGEGPTRFSSSDINEIYTDTGNFEDGNYLGSLASNMFFVNTQIPDGTTVINVEYNIQFSFRKNNNFGSGKPFRVELSVFDFDDVTGFYNITENEILYIGNSSTSTQFGNLVGSKQFSLTYNQGVALTFSNGVVFSNFDAIRLGLSKHDLKVSVSSFFEGSSNLSFMFIHDIYQRLFYILTGDKNSFYSKWCGRTEKGYYQDGEAGLIGLISGIWLRAFDNESDKYKSLQSSLKNMFTSDHAVFNIGATIERIGFKERFRIEKLNYFYQDRTIIRLPQIVTDEEIKIDDKSFFSSIEIGYDKGGDYENAVGLDEPNAKTNFITPIRKNGSSFRKISKTRSDETEMELTRRKPQFLYPQEDTKGDLHNWYLDLKRTIGLGYVQKIWSDRLEELPTGVNYPENYKSFFFTPLTMLFRHGWVLRAGLEPYKNKFIKYINSVTSSNLFLFFTGNSEGYNENIENLPVNKLERSKVNNNIVTFKHPLNDELLDLIKGTTKILVEGEYEDVLNVYFKIEWTNEFGETKKGYLLNLKPSEIGEFTLQESNENIL